jgi:hypothetical protein
MAPACPWQAEQRLPVQRLAKPTSDRNQPVMLNSVAGFSFPHRNVSSIFNARKAVFAVNCAGCYPEDQSAIGKSIMIKDRQRTNNGNVGFQLLMIEACQFVMTAPTDEKRLARLSAVAKIVGYSAINARVNAVAATVALTKFAVLIGIDPSVGELIQRQLFKGLKQPCCLAEAYSRLRHAKTKPNLV